MLKNAELGYGWRAPANKARDHRNREQDDCNEKYDLRCFDCDAGNDAEAKQSRDQRDNKERDGPA